MAVDSEYIYDKTILGVKLKEYSSEELDIMWKNVFGANGRIRREKFTKVKDDLTRSEDRILEGAKLINLGNQSALIWNEEGEDKHLIIDDKSFIGIQNHESGEKSVVVVRPSSANTDKNTIRRFTAVK
ncbi:MAG: hypothetical protein PHR98_02505 [Candidatus Shapirobacteria bacterium]|jgi:hypothetical protein|nr:hypothetical protein [Candidatus Shapirobacteria bacterium]